MKFYRFELEPTVNGLRIQTIVYVPVHESPMTFWCVKEHDADRIKAIEGELTLQAAKRRGRRIRKIDKRHSRIAQPTKHEALRSLVHRKRRQSQYARRELEINAAFLRATDGKRYEELPEVLEETKEAVCSHYWFN